VDDQDGGDDPWLAHFGAVVSHYLRSGDSMPPDGGAAAFTEPIDRVFLHDDAWDDHVEGMLWSAWQAVIAAADTPDDAVRSRLVGLLTAIKGQGVLVRSDGQECTVWDMRAHVDLPIFGALMRETWNFDPPAVSPGTWANLNAFAAQLTVGGIDFSLYGIWALRDALEEDDQEVSSVLPAAVQWLRCAGPVLASLALSGAVRDGAAWLGPLCVKAGLTELGYTTRRWNFWKSRLEEIAAAGGESAGSAWEGLRYLLAAGQQITD
jgi:hypothetical protein